jgi:hypothetical protein
MCFPLKASPGEVEEFGTLNRKQGRKNVFFEGEGKELGH